jgi:hypothetical protein
MIGDAPHLLVADWHQRGQGAPIMLANGGMGRMLDFDEIRHYTLIYTYDSTSFSASLLRSTGAVAQP